MKYFKNSNNEVYVYESDCSQDSFISSDLVAIAEDEANVLLQKIQDELTAKQQKIIPQALSRFQALTVLKLTKLDDGQTLYKATDEYINSLSDDTVENLIAKTVWETAQEFRRDSALIKLVQNTFELTDGRVDEIFIEGAKITP